MMTLNKNVFGLIHDYYPRDRLISIKIRGKIYYFHYPKNLKRYLEIVMAHKHAYIDFLVEDEIKIIRGCVTYKIKDAFEIFFESNHERVVVYTGSALKEEIRDLINERRYKMFMDLELTMPNYGTKDFSSEILQIGCVILDLNDNIVNYYSNYVKTMDGVSDRTYRFLSLGPEAEEEAIPYDEFYNDYKNLIDIYNPIIYVWGNTDYKALDASYIKYSKKNIKGEYRDLSNLIHKYYELSNEISLFKALKIFKNLDVKQIHHALTDAQATKEVFEGFKKDINGLTMIDVKEEVLKLKQNNKVIV